MESFKKSREVHVNRSQRAGSCLKNHQSEVHLIFQKPLEKFKFLSFKQDLSSSCDYVMDFEKLQTFTKEISGQGNLLLSGTLACKTDLNAASENLRGFLFEKIIVFAYIVDSVERLERQYIYKTYIQV